MSGPWEKYGAQAAPQSDAAPAGPWAKYAAAPPPTEPAAQPRSVLQTAGDAVAGAVRGAGSIGATLLAPVDIAKDALDGKGLSLESNRERRASMDAALGNLGADTDSTAFKVGKVGAEVAGTLGAGGALARAVPLAAGAATPLANALATGGMRAGNVAAGAPLAARAADMATRVAGGAAAGGASAALVDPETAAMGAGIGAALPPALAAAGKAGRVVGSAIAPFTQGGKDRIVGGALREFASDADAAQAALRSAPSVVPGSAPTTAAAAGDIGLAGLQRTVINRSPGLAAEAAERASQQNEARTRALEAIAGNQGRIAAAEEARDVATGAMREAALDRAGNVEAGSLLGGIDRMLAQPGNAGLLVQRALRQVRSQIGGQLDNGAVNARALYAIRKDVNDILGGRLQGESGNLRHASSQLIGVKGLIDDAIEAASNRVVPSAGRGMAGAGQSGVVPRQTGAAAADGVTNAQPAASWREYLRQYADQSVPIDQMRQLQDIFQRVQTGTADARGQMVLSAAKLNNLLKQQGDELARTLAPEQLQVLRNVQADLNASTLANTAGKAVGSNTVQNLGSDQFLTQVLGNRVGGSGVARETLGRVAGFAARRANVAIEERLGEALMDPNTASLLLELSKRPDLLQRLGQTQGAALSTRAIPVLATGGGRN